MKFHQAEFGMSQLPADEVGQDFPLIIATMPASSRQRAVAVGVVIVLMVAADDGTIREHTGPPDRLIHPGFANRFGRRRSPHGNFSVRSIFYPAATSVACARERLHIQRLICIPADARLSGRVRARRSDW